MSVIQLFNREEHELQAFKGINRDFRKASLDAIYYNAVFFPAVDIIDFESYAHWHRLSDVPANCSAETLSQVARVLSVWLQRTRKA